MYQLGGSPEKGQSTLYITGPSSGSGDEEPSDFRIVVRQLGISGGGGEKNHRATIRGFFVQGSAPEKKLLGSGKVQENTAHHSAQGLERIPTIHSQSTHKLSTGARLAKHPIPHYLVSRTRRRHYI